ncbi:MAG TPA: hypothetical protein VFL77_03745 [Solirubrobacterales bacterium]|nr:hypothetical protein [Solirubrobacterales bacterium]
MQNFSILRVTGALRPGTIPSVHGKELSAVIAECAEVTQRAAARTEKARADIEVSSARVEAARAGIEEARRRQESAVAKAEETRAEFQAQARRTEEMMAENAQWTKRIFAELDDQRDERRALIEALLRLTDRLPPPPPDLRSA